MAGECEGPGSEAAGKPSGGAEELDDEVLWLRQQSFAVVRLGLSLGDFLSLRPVDLAVMAHTYRRVQEEEQWSHASLMACIVNSGFSAPKGGVKPSDFMPREERLITRKPKRMTAKRRDEVADGIRKVMAQFMKKEDKRPQVG